jgi:hypothetical protein
VEKSVEKVENWPAKWKNRPFSRKKLRLSEGFPLHIHKKKWTKDEGQKVPAVKRYNRFN